MLFTSTYNLEKTVFKTDECFILVGYLFLSASRECFENKGRPLHNKTKQYLQHCQLHYFFSTAGSKQLRLSC